MRPVPFRVTAAAGYVGRAKPYPEDDPRTRSWTIRHTFGTNARAFRGGGCHRT